MSYKATKPGLLSVVYLSMFYVLLIIRALFMYEYVSFCCYVFCLFVVLVELSVLAKWLARKTPLRKPNRGKGIVSRKPRPKSAHDFLGLLYCFIVLLCICVVSCPYMIYYPTVMAWYSLVVLKVLLNPMQANKQTVEAATRCIMWFTNFVFFHTPDAQADEGKTQHLSLFMFFFLRSSLNIFNFLCVVNEIHVVSFLLMYFGCLKQLWSIFNISL